MRVQLEKTYIVFLALCSTLHTKSFYNDKTEKKLTEKKKRNNEYKKANQVCKNDN
jgi:hypothetical protein